MKQLIGKDIGSYVFDKTTKMITFSGVILSQEQILTITNTTDQILIYCFADSSLGGDLVGSVLTLNYDTSAMSNTDSLQIYVDVPDVVQLVQDSDVFSQTSDLAFMIRYLISAASDPVYLNKTTNALQTLLLSGSTTAVTGTLTGVTTVTGLTNIGGKSADMVTNGIMDVSWGNLRGVLI